MEDRACRRVDFNVPAASGLEKAFCANLVPGGRATAGQARKSLAKPHVEKMAQTRVFIGKDLFHKVEARTLNGSAHVQDCSRPKAEDGIAINPPSCSRRDTGEGLTCSHVVTSRRACPSAASQAVRRARTLGIAPRVFPVGIIFRRPPDLSRSPVFLLTCSPALTTKIEQSFNDSVMVTETQLRRQARPASAKALQFRKSCPSGEKPFLSCRTPPSCRGGHARSVFLTDVECA